VSPFICVCEHGAEFIGHVTARERGILPGADVDKISPLRAACALLMYLQRTSRVRSASSKGPFQGSRANLITRRSRSARSMAIMITLAPRGARCAWIVFKTASAPTFDNVQVSPFSIPPAESGQSISVSAIPEATGCRTFADWGVRLIAARIKCLPPSLPGENNEQLTRRPTRIMELLIVQGPLHILVGFN